MRLSSGQKADIKDWKAFFKYKTTPNDCSYGELFKKVSEFEAQGYELTETNVLSLGQGAIPRNHVLLRKTKL